MQIQNSSSPNFQGIRMQSSKMNKKQLGLCDRLIDAITYSDSYIKSHENNIDLYFLPDIGNKLKVYFVDKISDMCFLQKGKKSKLKVNIFNDCRLNKQNSMMKGIEDGAHNIENSLNTILDGTIPRPEYNYQKILDSKTDVAKLRPEHYEIMFNEVNEFDDIRAVKKEDDKYAPEILEF